MIKCVRDVEEFLELDYDTDDDQEYIEGLYPAQDAALLYEEYQTCQGEKYYDG
jgi:hypothetical protein